MLRFKHFVTLLLLAITLPSMAQSTYWFQRKTLFDQLPVNSNDIIFLGNSITDGGEWCELFGMLNVKNRGISGDIVNNVRKRLEQVTKGHPAKIFLLIGINDVSHKGETVESIAANYEKLVDEIMAQTPGTKLYIQSVFPVKESYNIFKGLNGRGYMVKPLNEKIKQIAKKRGLTYIDLYKVLQGPDGNLSDEYTNDGLHLTGPGYKAWVEAVSKYVKE